ncbi:MAG: glucan biosynthesis protein, partial [Pseudomonadota bacterium]
TYQAIGWPAARRIWAGEGRRFTLEPLPPGLVFDDAVALHLVEDGAVGTLAFDAADFDLPPAGADAAFTGVAVRFPLHRPDRDDRVAVFQGASYFRAVGRDQRFGVQARGLAVATGEPGGEEFPTFTDLWLYRPAPGATSLDVPALLDSPSVAGAFAFRIQPGAETNMAVEAVLFPREDLGTVGIAPLTSMFLFGGGAGASFDDPRGAVHNSAGLQMLTGQGEQLWRPSSNPRDLEIAYFVDADPGGFGLVQRPRDFAHFGDVEARFDRRPSVWVTPTNGWGPGGVMLVEIPSRAETNDNVVAFWRPAVPLRAGEPARFGYVLSWGEVAPDTAPLARVLATRTGHTPGTTDGRRFLVDFALAEGQGADALRALATTSRGVLHAARLVPLPDDEATVRIILDLEPPAEGDAELYLRLAVDGTPASETWLYRWSR